MTAGRNPLPEIERRRRQLEVIEAKGKRAETRKDPVALAAAALAHASVAARIRDLEAAESSEPPRRRRGQEG